MHLFIKESDIISLKFVFIHHCYWSVVKTPVLLIVTTCCILHAGSSVFETYVRNADDIINRDLWTWPPLVREVCAVKVMIVGFHIHPFVTEDHAPRVGWDLTELWLISAGKKSDLWFWSLGSDNVEKSLFLDWQDRISKEWNPLHFLWVMVQNTDTGLFAALCIVCALCIVVCAISYWLKPYSSTWLQTIRM